MIFLINCSNLKAGGGLQVADSICSQLDRFSQHHFLVVLSPCLKFTPYIIPYSALQHIMPEHNSPAFSPSETPSPSAQNLSGAKGPIDIGTKGSDPSVYVFTVYAASAFMPCPASAGAAETANGAVERMVLLGLTGVYYTISAAMRLWCGRNQIAAQTAAETTPQAPSRQSSYGQTSEDR